MTYHCCLCHATERVEVIQVEEDELMMLCPPCLSGRADGVQTARMWRKMEEARTRRQMVARQTRYKRFVADVRAIFALMEDPQLNEMDEPMRREEISA